MWSLITGLAVPAILLGAALGHPPSQTAQDVPTSAECTFIAPEGELYFGCMPLSSPYRITYNRDSVSVNGVVVLDNLDRNAKKAVLRDRIKAGTGSICTFAFLMREIADSLSLAGWPTARTAEFLRSQLATFDPTQSSFDVKDKSIVFPGCRFVLTVTEPEHMARDALDVAGHYAAGLRASLGPGCLVLLLPEGDCETVRGADARAQLRAYLSAIGSDAKSAQASSIRAAILQRDPTFATILGRIEEHCSTMR